MTEDLEKLKSMAAEAALAEIEPGMTIGLGTGSTAALMIARLGERVAREGLAVRAVPTSARSEALARAAGIPLVGFDAVTELDLVIDGADQIAGPALDLLKGLGGALLWEKIVADTARRLVIIADHTKRVARLTPPLPIEVIPFGVEATARKIARRTGAEARLRRSAEGAPFRTDSGNFILDCGFSAEEEIHALDADLRSIVGVVETGFFLGRTARVYLATPRGVEVLDPH
jgi:ribose 5-phosphate isomerase A